MINNVVINARALSIITAMAAIVIYIKLTNNTNCGVISH